MRDVNDFDMYVCFRNTENKTWGETLARTYKCYITYQVIHYISFLARHKKIFREVKRYCYSYLHFG